MVVDVHAHALSQKFLSDLTKKSVGGFSTEADGGGFRFKRGSTGAGGTLDKNLHNLERRIGILRERQFELQLFGPPPGFVSWAGGAASVEWSRALNQHASELSIESKGLIEPYAVPCMGDPAAAAEELRRAVGEYGLRAVIMPTTGGGIALEDERFTAIFDVIEELELLVFMHPTAAMANDRFPINGLHVLFGWPFETTLAITRMIFSGFLDRHPSLKMVIAHTGGNIIYSKGRLDGAFDAEGWERHDYYRNNVRERPSNYLKRLYYDTLALTPEGLRFVISTVGADRFMFGGDYPFDIADAEGRMALPVLEEYPEREREMMKRKTALAALSKR